MKYITLIFLVVFIPSISLGQDFVVEDDSLILWQKNRLLKWEDFKAKGEKPKDIHLVHQVAATTPILKTAYVKNKDGVEKEILLCYFSKHESWSITEDTQILDHEQIHFDIMEIFTRKIRKEYRRLESIEVKDWDKYDAITVKLIEESTSFHNKYDEEVLLNHPKQQEWRKCIDKELEELKEYEFIPE